MARCYGESSDTMCYRCTGLYDRVDGKTPFGDHAFVCVLYTVLSLSSAFTQHLGVESLKNKTQTRFPCKSLSLSLSLSLSFISLTFSCCHVLSYLRISTLLDSLLCRSLVGDVSKLAVQVTWMVCMYVCVCVLGIERERLTTVCRGKSAPGAAPPTPRCCIALLPPTRTPKGATCISAR
jgi:hypothetical protein